MAQRCWRIHGRLGTRIHGSGISGFNLASLRVNKWGWENRTVLTFAKLKPWTKPDFPAKNLWNSDIRWES